MHTGKPSLLVWQPDYEIGFAPFDAEHRELFNFANRIVVAVDEQDGQDFVQTCFKLLLKYAEHHFLNEEVNMAEAQYHEFSRHREAHTRDIETIGKFASQFAAKPLPAVEVRDFLHHALLEHILKGDSQFVPILNGRKSMLTRPRKLL